MSRRVETFFTHVPQLPRMIHRPTLMTNIRLPPTSPNFPHSSLLHAICASASSHTGWVNNVAPDLLEDTVERQKSLGLDMENLEDFGLAQAESAQRTIRHASQTCLFAPGKSIFEVAQAAVCRPCTNIELLLILVQIILADLYFTKGMPLQATITAAIPARLMKTIEMHNKNVPKRWKEPLFPEPIDAIEREERLATVWMAFSNDAGFSVNSCWSQSMDLGEIRCNLPTSVDEWRKRVSRAFPGRLHELMRVERSDAGEFAICLFTESLRRVGFAQYCFIAHDCSAIQSATHSYSPSRRPS